VRRLLSDFSRYHNRLIDYLRLKGIEGVPGNISCFNPRHVHSGKHTPSMSVVYSASENKETFNCFGSCGAHGDIYDAVELLEGITDKKGQYQFLEKLLGGGHSSSTAPGANARKRGKFTADPAAKDTLEEYLKKITTAEREKDIIDFLNLRAQYSTQGLVPSYPDDLIPAMIKFFYYWPGLKKAMQDIGSDALYRAGIPLRNPDTGVAWWDHAGVILKLGSGYKLHYYMNGECKKFGSKLCNPLPLPQRIDKTKPVIFVEGEMDAVSAAAAGMENACSSCGTSGITGPKIKEFLLDIPEIIICFDADDAGRSASGLTRADAAQAGRKTCLPDILRASGFAGKIKIAELPKNIKETDPDALVIAGKREILINAIKNAKEYIPPEKKAAGKSGVKFEFLTPDRLRNVLKKITKESIEEKTPEDVQPFISAVAAACGDLKTIEKDLLAWGAAKEQIKAKDDASPFLLIEFAWKYGMSKYLQRALKSELTPVAEFAKRINRHKPAVAIDFKEIRTNKNALQFLETNGVRSAALMVSDILDGRVIYIKSENEYYFFNGHTWQYEPDITGIIYNIIMAVTLYFYHKEDLQELGLKKSDIEDLIVKMEGRRFRVETMQEFSQLEQFGVFKRTVSFDGPETRETLTLVDGVMDFSGKSVIFRKSKIDEYRREILPYTVEEMKNAGHPERFKSFIQGSFENNDTLESLLFYLSLIPSRNTKYKYGGVFIGKTNTGKTSTMEILQAVFPGMIKTIPAEVLVSKGMRHVSGNEATPYIAMLEGKGAGLASETGRNMNLNNALWKLLTGGDTLTARALYQAPHEFSPTSQIIILTNNLPFFDNHDDATIQRMIIIPFLVQHKRGAKDLIQIDKFKEEIRHEYPGIVKMLAEYYIRLKHEHNGMIPLSDDCQRYKKSYVEELDTDLDIFVKTNIDITMQDADYVETRVAYERYLEYCRVSMEGDLKDVLPRNKFTRRLKRDYKEIIQKQKKINGKPELCFFRIRLINPDAKADAPPPKENPFE
jgi:hypothetical protein